ncbi:MAG: BatD family protein [Flavobacteriales bacterium]
MKSIKYIFLLLLLPQQLLSQSVQFAARVSRNSLGMDENFQLEIATNTDGKVTLPDLSSFRIIGGPNRSSFSSTSFSNGQRIQVNTYSWTYWLMPVKEGEFTIGAAKLVFEGKEYTTDPIKIKVGKAKDPSFYQDNSRQQIFISIRTNRNKVYEGEHVVVSYTVNNRLMRASIEDHEFPNQTGCWMQIIDPGQKGWPSYTEKSDGMDYQVTIFKKEILYPNSFGTLKLKPYKMKILGQDRFFTKQFDLTSNSASLEVLPLPQGKPESFSGAVGKFKMEASINKTELKTNDGIDLTVKINGNGNFMFIDKIPFSLPSDIETYDPEIKEKLSYSESGTNGSKEFRYLLIPRKKGKYTIGPIQFSYFDPEKKQYFTIESEAFPITVLKGENEDQPSMVQSSEVEIIDQDIRHYPSYRDDSFQPDHLFFGSKLFFFLLLTGPLAYILVIFIGRKRSLSPEEIISNKQKKASKFAIQQLESARKALEKGDSSTFYAELWKALNGYLSNKLLMEISGMTKENIRSVMEKKGAGAIEIDAFLRVIELCELTRFGMAQSVNGIEIYNETLSLIDQLESQLK